MLSAAELFVRVQKKIQSHKSVEPVFLKNKDVSETIELI
jgi:hypothetical protein